MEIRLCDITNNNTDIRDYFIVDDEEILINDTHLYDVILDTDKVVLHQQLEMFDSMEKMFKKAQAFDEIKKYVVSKHDEFEDRKDRADTSFQFDYFSTLQKANAAIIVKCNELESD
ncbi:hypothetical protein ACWEWU_14575 [Staphylococcus xylosus]